MNWITSTNIKRLKTAEVRIDSFSDVDVDVQSKAACMWKYISEQIINARETKWSLSITHPNTSDVIIVSLQWNKLGLTDVFRRINHAIKVAKQLHLELWSARKYTTTITDPQHSQSMTAPFQWFQKNSKIRKRIESHERLARLAWQSKTMQVRITHINSFLSAPRYNRSKKGILIDTSVRTYANFE